MDDYFFLRPFLPFDATFFMALSASSNLAYAYGWLDTPDSRNPLALKRGGIGHINLIWQPVKQFSTGIEYMWGAQRVKNDALGKAERIQLMGKFEF